MNATVKTPLMMSATHSTNSLTLTLPPTAFAMMMNVAERWSVEHWPGGDRLVMRLRPWPIERTPPKGTPVRQLQRPKKDGDNGYLSFTNPPATLPLWGRERFRMSWDYDNDCFMLDGPKVSELSKPFGGVAANVIGPEPKP